MIKFTDLVHHFPRVINPCSDGFTNQCAIRMSIALAGADPDFLSDFRGNRCSHGHARSASRLANYLKERLGRPIVSRSRPTDGEGILFYKRSEMNHIDLWTTRMCLPRYGRGNPRTMSWTTTDASEYWFWLL